MSETSEPFGACRLSPWRAAIRRIMLQLPDNRLGKHVRSVLRRVMLAGWSGPVDIDDFCGARLRLHHADNLADKYILASGDMYDRAERAAFATCMEQLWQAGKQAVFVDLGANNGSYSLTLAGRAIAAGRPLTVIAIEPDAINRERLAFNVAATGAGPIVRIDPRAASDVRERVVMAFNPENRGGIPAVSAASGDRDAVDALPLLDLLADNGVRADMLKVDIEGRDFTVLEKFLADAAPDQRPGLIVAEAWAGERDRMRALFEGHGYAVRDISRHNLCAEKADPPS
ncbi:MAG: FkbM family methyltransferase [Rhodobiaceae bacterium]|nr:FkbM family methyltransferase [Rhodobiaceae bacterium]